MIRRFTAAAGLVLLLANMGQADFLTFDDIQSWSGTGSNRAGFVVDWNGQSYAWGYRWDGVATGEDMLRAITGSNTGLYATAHQFSFGLGVFGVGYDLNRDGQFNTSPPLIFDHGIADTTPDDSRVVGTIGDLYTEGWLSAGYWADWSKADSTADWAFGNGLSSDVLDHDGQWIGLSFAPDFNGSAPADPIAALAAVPEPGPFVLLALVAIFILMIRQLKKKWGLASAL